MSIRVVRYLPFPSAEKTARRQASKRASKQAAGKPLEAAWGLVRDRRLLPLPGKYGTLAEFLAKGAPVARKLARQKKLPAGRRLLELAAVQLLSPVTTDAQIVCQGKNYPGHLKETGVRPKDKGFNLIFTKAASALTGARGAIERPVGVRLLDYEIELGLVLGAAPDLAASAEGHVDLQQCVVGLVVANDVSARDIQVPQGQWFKGKSFRTFCPAGPYLVLLDRDDYGRLGDLQLTLRVNGELRQQGQVRDMIYPPSETLAELAGILDLKAGDLLLSGTPGGVAMQVPAGLRAKFLQFIRSPKEHMRNFVETQAASRRYLNDGDVIHASIATADGALDLGMQELTVAVTK